MRESSQIFPKIHVHYIFFTTRKLSSKKKADQYLHPVGNVQLSFRWIEREATDQAAYDRNFEAYKRRVAFVAPNLAGLNIAIPSLSEPTPATKIYQGLKHNYQGLKRLGSGAHGDVNKVHDSKHGNAYAIKCLRPGGVKEDFEKEVRLLKSIEPHVSKSPRSF